ncbi:RNA polymerase sigma factor [Parapedobacter sp.]
MSKCGLNTIKDFRKGDPAALEAYFNKYKRRLHYFATSFLLKHNEEQVEEIVLDSFVKLWQRRARFESEEKIKAYLYIVTKNACLSFMNSAHAKQRFDAEISADLLIEEPESHAKLIKAELFEMISKEIHKLPKTQQKVIQLSHYEGKNPSEISEALHMSKNTVYVNYSRAITTLRKAFNKRKDWLYNFFL